MFSCSAVCLSLSLQLLFSWATLCSEYSDTVFDHKFLELTPQSLSQFTSCLKSGSPGHLAAELRDNLDSNDSYQLLCLKYLIGSIAVFGKVDEGALSVIRRFCHGRKIAPLSKLLQRLAENNNSDAAAQFIARNLKSPLCAGTLEDWLIKLIKEDWDVVRRLIKETLAVSGDFNVPPATFHGILRSLPIEDQYEAISTGSMLLSTIEDLYDLGEYDTSLRKVFALARCSYNSSLKVRKYIAKRFPYFGQFLATDTANSRSQCPVHIPTLDDDAWLQVFMHLDTETLMFVLPLVCALWCRLHSRVLTHFTNVHDMYLQDMRNRKLSAVCRIAPWDHCLPSKENATRYFGCCIANGALERTTCKNLLKYNVEKYLKAVVDGRAPLPRFQNCLSPCDSFVKLFETIYECYGDEISSLHKPIFLADNEYEQVVYRLVRQKGWILGLPKSLVIDSMPRLFNILEQDEELMRKLIIANTGNFFGASISLILCGQASEVPDKLAKCVFSQFDQLRGLVEPEIVHHSRYYNFLAEHDALPELMMRGSPVGQLPRLVVSLVLSFRADPGKIDRIMTSVVGHFSRRSLDWRLLVRRTQIEAELAQHLRDTAKCSPEDADFVEEVMMRFGWLSQFGRISAV